jgi:Skp family chaperone for outer membrane proteins
MEAMVVEDEIVSEFQRRERKYNESMEELRIQVDTQSQRAEAEAQRAEAESQKAKDEFLRAETEARKAKEETQRADSESQKAKAEAQRAEAEAQRANEAFAKISRMVHKRADSGMSVSQIADDLEISESEVLKILAQNS